MWILIAVLMVLICAVECSANTDEIFLSEGSIPRATIIVPDDAIPAERTAATELAGHLKQVTGADFPIVSSPDQAQQGTRVFIGQTDTTKDMMPDFDFAKLGHDGIVIRKIGTDLVLAGDRPRGTLYAVYAFLEDTVGCRWWTPDVSYIPNKPTLRVRVKDVTYTPPFRCRETFYKSVIQKNPEFATRLKLNGHFQSIPEELGGHYSILDFVHSFYPLIPPEKYFADHPEWFSLVGGKRVDKKAQLCLTNDEMRKELTKNALALIKTNPEAGIISISINDEFGWCECEKCQAISVREGAESGPILDFVNKVAADIEKEYPDFLVDTIAYIYARTPPKTIKARHNVVVRFCSLDLDFSKPITAPENAKFYGDLKKWKSISQRMYVWDYLMNLENLLMPHPNWRTIGPNIRTFRKNNVINLFEQGDGYNPDANFAPLRTWLMAHLMWDPSANQRVLMKRFLDGYYGPAGKQMLAFIDLTCDAVARPGAKLPIFTKDFSFLTPDDLNKASAIFDEAEKAVQGDEVLLKRVRLQRLALDHAILMNSPAPGLPTGKELEQILDRFLTFSDESGNNFREENRPMSQEYRDQLKAKVSGLSP